MSGEQVKMESLQQGVCLPMEMVGLSNKSSPRPAGIGLKEHVIKLDSLDVADNEGKLRSQ